MRIGGFLKQSLIDWEGMIAAVIFTKGCNFRCGYCHNPSLVLPELFKGTEDIEIEDEGINLFTNLYEKNILKSNGIIIKRICN